MKRYCFIILFFWLTIDAFAIPAKRTFFKVMLEDGTYTSVCLVGDETFHFLVTADGTPVLPTENGAYRLSPQSKDEISSQWAKRLSSRNEQRLRKVRKLQQQRRVFGHPTSYIGKKKGLVILVNFADLTMKTTSTLEAFDNQFNQEGYRKNGHQGSVRDYFIDASYGKFEIDFDVVGPVTVSKSYSYYGRNNRSGDDSYPATMVAEACLKIDSLVNFKDYDWDEDGFVDQVYVIYAGYGEHAGASSNTIWPHEYELSTSASEGDGPGAIFLDSVTIDTYAMSCELSGVSGSTIDGIGTACHEFSHCLGLPDFYDTSYSGGFGMNTWDLLDFGSYNGPTNDGQVPAGFTAYERWFAGWMELEELSESKIISEMPSLQDSACAYVMYNDADRNEFFILENRQNRGWFQYVGTNESCHGLLIYHVDFDSLAWEDNSVNSLAKHQRMSIVPANNTYGKFIRTLGQYELTNSQLIGQLFPGNMNVTEFKNGSHDEFNGKLFNKNTDESYNLNKSITDISEENGLISFNFNNNQGTIDDAIFIEESEEPLTEYYTLSGTKIRKPIVPGVYVIKQNGKFKKCYLGH
ncbi:MAG: M6 family metalloprotease domain-containing protein [Bacteroidaceae bacterium]|nr:M6 family metalloprotease domain-containing protein [Bacteroidaceae bacterium]